MVDDDVVTAEDITQLNRAAVERAAAFARLVGAALVVIGALSTLGWGWVEYRGQSRADDGGFGSFGSGVVGADDRIDLFVTYLPLLLWASGAVVVGLLARLIAYHLVNHVGGSITGWQVGDRFGEQGADDVMDDPSGR